MPVDGSLRPKKVGFGVLKHYCNYRELLAFVGLHCNN